MAKAKHITVAGPDGEPVRIELVKKPMSKKKQHWPKESNVVTSILEYLNSLPGVKAIKRHQNKYQRNQPDIDMCASPTFLRNVYLCQLEYVFSGVQL